MKILLVDDEAIIRNFCTIVLENIFDLPEIFEAHNANRAIELIKEHQSFDLIISDFEMPEGNGNDLAMFLRSIQYARPYLSYTSCFKDEMSEVSKFLEEKSNRAYLQKPTPLGEFKKTILSLVSSTENEEEYQRIRIIYFLKFNKALCDIYLKLSDKKYIKVIKGGDQYLREDVDKYLEKDQKYLYVKTEDYNSFVDKYLSVPFLEFIETPDANRSAEDKLASIHLVMTDLVSTVGVEKTAVALADNYMKTVIDVVENKSLSSMLFKLKSSNNYVYEHSYMAACLATFVLKRLEWGTPSMIQKVCYAALFHDILIDDPKIALCHDLSEESIKDLSKNELKFLVDHPKKTAEILEKEKSIPSEIIDMVLNHHELPDGSGFPRNLSSHNIRPLTAVFILSHEFVRQLYIHKFDERSHKDILTYIFNVYNDGSYKEILDAFYQTLTFNSVFEE